MHAAAVSVVFVVENGQLLQHRSDRSPPWQGLRYSWPQCTIARRGSLRLLRRSTSIVLLIEISPRRLRRQYAWPEEVAVAVAVEGGGAVEVPAGRAGRRKRRMSEWALVLVGSIARRPSAMGPPRSARRNKYRSRPRHHLRLQVHQLTAVWHFLAPTRGADRRGR